MANQFLELFTPNQVDNAAPESLLTVPAGVATTILRNGLVRFSNTTGNAATIKCWAVPSGGSPTDANVCVPTRTIAANDYFDTAVPVISAGGKFYAQAGTATAITATCLNGFYQS